MLSIYTSIYVSDDRILLTPDRRSNARFAEAVVAAFVTDRFGSRRFENTAKKMEVRTPTSTLKTCG
jgi:hypothetical protein